MCNIPQAFASLRRGGRLSCVGLPADDKITISVFDTVLSGKQIIGSIVGTRNDLVDVFALHAAGRTKVIAEPRHLEDVNACFDEVLAGHVPVTDGGASATDGIVGSGVLRIRPLDFAWQLTTFRVHGPDRMGEFRAFDAFARLFIGELWQVFEPLRRDR